VRPICGSNVGWALAHHQNRQHHVIDTEGRLKPTLTVRSFCGSGGSPPDFRKNLEFHFKYYC